MLQVQRSALTREGGYELDRLLEVERIRLTPDGAFGLKDGQWIVDRHHRHHPDATRWDPGDVLSVGFTSHYEHMWTLARTTGLGEAGENLIVDAPAMLTIDDLAGGIRIDTSTAVIDLTSPEIAEPCVEFTRFMADRPEADAYALKPLREQLRNGVRGFVAGYDSVGPVDIAVGDKVSVRAR